MKRIRKKLMLVLAFIMVTLLSLAGFVGCDENAVSDKNYPAFQYIGPAMSNGDLYYDTETKVIYLIVKASSSNRSGVSITPVYNADGSLKVYKGEK